MRPCSPGPSRSFLQPDSGRRREDTVALPDCGAGRCGSAADCGRTPVSRTCRHLLGSLRGVGGCADETSASRLGGGPKKGLRTELQNDIVQEIEALLGRQSIRDLDFEAVEMAARRQALRLAARALEQRLNIDTSDHAGPGTGVLLRRPCAISWSPRKDVRERTGAI